MPDEDFVFDTTDDDDLSTLLANSSATDMNAIPLGMEDDITGAVTPTTNFTGPTLMNGMDNGFSAGGNYLNGIDGYNPMVAGGTTPPPKKSVEDQLSEAIIQGSKLSFSFLKDLVQSFKSFDVYKLQLFGKRTMFGSLILFVFGLIVLFFKKSLGLNYMITGGLSLSVGITAFMLSSEKIKNNSAFSNTSNTNVNTQPVEQESVYSPMQMTSQPPVSTQGTWGEENQVTESDPFDFNLEEEPSPSIDTANQDEAKNSWLESIEDDFETSKVSNNATTSATPTIDNLDITLGISRSRLFELYQKQLYNKEGAFWEFAEYTDINDVHVQSWIKKLNEATYNERQKTQEIIKVLSVKVSKTTIIIKATNPSFLKTLTKLEKSLVDLLSIDEKTGEILAQEEVPRVTAKSAGRNLMIYVYKPVFLSPTLKDSFLHEKVKQYVLDETHKIPIVSGIDANGNFLFDDFQTVYSMLIAGPPRHGKSCLFKLILGQFLAFTSPKDLNIYYCDIKGTGGDFWNVFTPHTKRMESDPLRVLDLYRSVVAEGDRRMQCIAGSKNIYEFNKKNPNQKLPTLMIMHDEVSTLILKYKSLDAENLKKSKEQKDPSIQTDYCGEFQRLLLSIIMKYPSAGIRVLLVVHLVKNKYLPTDITDQIPHRYGVCLFKKKDQESILGETVSVPFSHPGDIALSAHGSVTSFHSLMLAPQDTQEAEFISYLADLWSKLCPDEVENSLLNSANTSHLLAMPTDLYTDVENLDENSTIVEDLNRGGITQYEERAEDIEQRTQNKNLFQGTANADNDSNETDADIIDSDSLDSSTDLDFDNLFNDL